jgi:hypothetical protein
MHLNKFICKLVSQNVHIQVLIKNLTTNIIGSNNTSIHKFMCSYEDINDQKLK